MVTLMLIIDSDKSRMSYLDSLPIVNHGYGVIWMTLISICLINQSGG